MKKFLEKFAKVIITIAMITSLCFVWNNNKSNADAGYHSSYSGGSSSHSSSSHSSSSSHRSSSSSYSSGSSSSSSDGGSIVGLIIWFIIIAIIVYYSKRKGTTTHSISTKLKSNQDAINKLKELFPDFDEKQFLQNGYNIFLDVENAWMNFELEKVHNEITDEMYNMYESQISSMEIKGEQNIMSDFVLKDSAISAFRKENDNIEVTAKYIIEFYDYIIEKESGKVLRGNKNRKLRMHYDFTFIVSDSGEKVENCPNCGAPVDVNSSGTCEYCGAKLVGKNTKWVMSKKVCTYQENL